MKLAFSHYCDSLTTNIGPVTHHGRIVSNKTECRSVSIAASDSHAAIVCHQSLAILVADDHALDGDDHNIRLYIVESDITIVRLGIQLIVRIDSSDDSNVDVRLLY